LVEVAAAGEHLGESVVVVEGAEERGGAGVATGGGAD
jgi:hypothetical protein